MTSKIVEPVRDVYTNGMSKYIKIPKSFMDKVTDAYVSTGIPNNPEFNQTNLIKSRIHK
jgi:hypothetical protein